jgi:N-acetylated-alpha-linked acidic dipeptidase
MRVADAGGVPFDYTAYAAELREFVNETKRLANRKKLGDSFDGKGLLEAIDDLEDQASRIDKARAPSALYGQWLSEPASDENPKLRRINDALIQAERALVDDRGLRGRTWYKHQIYAPGFYTGYAALPLPDLRQAIEDGRAGDAKVAAERIVDAIKRAAEVLKKGRD